MSRKRKECPDAWNLKLKAILTVSKWGLQLGNPHVLSCILHDGRISWIYLYLLGFRDANQNLGVSEKVVQNILAGRTNILAGLTKSLPDSWVLLLSKGFARFLDLAKWSCQTLECLVGSFPHWSECVLLMSLCPVHGPSTGWRSLRASLAPVTFLCLD